MVFRFALLLTLAVAPFGAAAAADRWTVMIDGDYNKHAQGCVAPSGDDEWGRIYLFYHCMTPVQSGYSGHLYVEELQWDEAIDEVRLLILIDGTPLGEVILTRAREDWSQFVFPGGWDHAPLLAALRAGRHLTLQALPAPGQIMPPDVHISLVGSDHALGTMLSHCPSQ